MSPEQRKVRFAALVSDIQEEAAAGREATGSEVLGAEAMMSKAPHHRLEKLDRSPVPRFHVATREAWFELRDAYSWFLAV